MDMKGTSRLKIFTGTAHPALAKKFQIISAFRLESLCAEDLIMAKYRS